MGAQAANVAKANELAPSLEQTFQKYANYKDNPAELRQLKAELYKVLLPTVGKDKMVDLADRILRLQRK